MAAIIGAIVGGLIAARATRRAVQQSYLNDFEKRNIEKQENLQRFYRAIKSELNALWKRYEGAGEKIKNLDEGQPLLIHYPLTQDYFTIYQANAHLIGEIQNEELREDIILTYSAAKGAVDSYRYNNHIVGQYHHWNWLAAETDNKFYRMRAKDYLNSCIEYTVVLKKVHFEIKKLLQKLNEAIDKELSKCNT